MRARRLPPWWIFLLPLVAAAASRGLWAPDEPRRAEVAKEIYETGDFIVLRLCGEPYPDKPPLLYWLSGMLGWLTGWSEFAMRLVPLAATGATAWLLARWARRAFGELEAAYAPALFLGTVMLTHEGYQLQIDPLLMACTTAALYVAWTPVTTQRAVLRRTLWVGFWAGLGALAKGPVAFVDIGLPLVAWWAWSAWRTRPSKSPDVGAKREAPRLRPGAAAIVGSVALAVLPVLAWALAASVREPAIGRELFWGQHAGRVARGTQHVGPLWKNLVTMPFQLLPWTFVVLAGVPLAWRERKTESGRGQELARCLVWFAALLAFFSIIPTKRDIYLLPAYPAAALLGASALACFTQRNAVPRWIAASVALVFGALALTGLCAGSVIAALELDLPGITPFTATWRGSLAALPVALGLWSGLRCLRQSDVPGWVRAHLCGWAGTAFLAALLFFPLVDPLKSAEELGLWLAARPEKPSAIPCRGVKPEGFRFYGGVPTVPEEGSFDAALDREGDQFLGIIRPKFWARLEPGERARLRILREDSVGEKELLVVGRAPQPLDSGE